LEVNIREGVLASDDAGSLWLPASLFLFKNALSGAFFGFRHLA
jgi:hypothetical protein